MEVDLIGRSVNAPKFLGTLEKDYGWFISYTILLAEKHVEDPESKRIFVAVVLLGDYLWNIQTVRFEEVVYEAERTRRRKIGAPPPAVKERVLSELMAAYQKSKKLPAKIRKRLVEFQELHEGAPEELPR
jgi:DNA-directed RNA polymerase subunit K/omega